MKGCSTRVSRGCQPPGNGPILRTTNEGESGRGFMRETQSGGEALRSRGSGAIFTIKFRMGRGADGDDKNARRRKSPTG